MWNLKDLSAVQSINRMTWMFKNNCERRISMLWVSFSSWNKRDTSRGGAFGTKDCMIFLLKKTKKKVKATEREKDVSELHRLFLIMLSKILCWESPHHSHMTITADLMHETCFSDVQLLVWISCCFLKWYRSLRDFSSGPLLSTPGLCVDAIAPRVDANLCSFFYSSSSVDHACSGEEGSLRLQLNAEYCRYMILSWIILWFLRVSEHISARALLA